MGMKKKMLSATLCAVMVGSLAAPAFTVQAADDTLVYWSMWEATEPQGQVIQEAVDAYTEQTGVKVDLQFKGRTGNREALQPALDGGTQIVFTVSGSGEEDIITRTKAVEFSLPSDMDGMIKVEYEQDGEIIDSQYISSNLQTVSYTFTGQVGAHSLVRAYFTCINNNSVASSPTQEISF